MKKTARLNLHKAIPLYQTAFLFYQTLTLKYHIDIPFYHNGSPNQTAIPTDFFATKWHKSKCNLTISPNLTSITTFRFHTIATLQPKKRKEVKLFAYPRFIATFVHFDNTEKKEEKAPLTKIKTPTHNRPDKKKH